MNVANIPENKLTQLRRAFAGALIGPSDPAYEQTRWVWNRMIDRRPALIAQCTGTQDVVQAVRFAREIDLPVSVRGGGHNVAGYAVCDNGLMIDLAPMRGITIDPRARTVSVGGGARWADVDQATQPYGLATPGGEVSETGVAGLTLGGGVGYLRRRHGLSCDNLLSAEVVTADGEAVTASDNENSDLFWAIRGGGNFGVVTEFEFRLHPVGPEVMTLSTFYPAEDARRLLFFWRKFAQSAPEEATTAFGLWALPHHADIPPALRGRKVCLFDGMYAGDPAEGAEAFRPLRELGGAILDFSDRVPYIEAQRAFDDFFPDGGLYYWKSLFMEGIGDDAIEGIVSGAGTRPDPGILVIIRHLGGVIGRIRPHETAFSNRHAEFMLSIDGGWVDPGRSERNISWIRQYWQSLRPFSNGGVYLNFPGFEGEEANRWQSSHGPNYERLAQVKRTYDPENFFRFNQNITPG